MHLVLRRKKGESIVIGKNADITITFHRYKNGEGHIGIEASQDVIVNRLEVHEKKMRKKMQNASESIRK